MCVKARSPRSPAAHMPCSKPNNHLSFTIRPLGARPWSLYIVWLPRFLCQAAGADSNELLTGIVQRSYGRHSERSLRSRGIPAAHRIPIIAAHTSTTFARHQTLSARVGHKDRCASSAQSKLCWILRTCLLTSRFRDSSAALGMTAGARLPLQPPRCHCERSFSVIRAG